MKMVETFPEAMLNVQHAQKLSELDLAELWRDLRINLNDAVRETRIILDQDIIRRSSFSYFRFQFRCVVWQNFPVFAVTAVSYF